MYKALAIVLLFAVAAHAGIGLGGVSHVQRFQTHVPIGIGKVGIGGIGLGGLGYGGIGLGYGLGGIGHLGYGGIGHLGGLGYGGIIG